MESGTGGSGRSGGDGMSMLGKLICDMNPYTEMPKYAMSGALKTGKMQVFVGNPSAATSEPTGTAEPTGTVEQIEVEVDAGYNAQWAFKGQTHNVNTALRVKYRFPVLDSNNNPLYWVTEHLLIGYEGSGAG
jgi:hypothetical protein